MRGVGGAGTLSGVTSLAGDSSGYCALLTSGHVDCWTAGDDVPLALPGPDGTGTLSGVKSVVSDGQGSYCALLTSGRVDCWGDNQAGELGNGDPTAFPGATPVAVAGVGGSGTLSGVSSLAPGHHSYCAILTSTGLACWGYDNHGELGNGTGGPELCSNGLSCSSSPVRVNGLGGNGLMSGVLSLTSTGSAGSAGSFCAVLDANGLACWGWNYVVGGSQFDPSPVAGLGGAVVRTLVGNLAVSRGTMDGSYCAILKSGAVDCWRRGTEGQLGDGHASNSTVVVDNPEAGGTHLHDVPVAVSGTGGAGRLSVARMVAGQESFCAVLTSGGVDCWGANAGGNLGIGTMTGPEACLFSQPCSIFPRAVKGVAGHGTLSNAVSVASDGASYCAVRASGEVDCWGQNSSGQLGNGGTMNSAVPVVALAGP
jgi:alpha-tubulin suppressor-like RCC1 family protein